MRLFRRGKEAVAGLIVIVVISLSLLTVGLRPDHNLERYVSYAARSGVRVSLLIPSGWTPELEIRRFPDGGPNPIVIRPILQTSPVLEALGRLTRIPPERNAGIWIYFRETPAGGNVFQTYETSASGQRVHVADAVLPAGRGSEISIQYLRNDSRAFAATSQRILNSIRVIQ